MAVDQIKALSQRRLHDSTHSANTSAGQRSMHALREPPGHPLGLGLGDGEGVGDGVGPSIVEPMAPNLISEKITLALACLDSTSFGTPDVVGQVPRAAPGSLESTGYVE